AYSPVFATSRPVSPRSAAPARGPEPRRMSQRVTATDGAEVQRTVASTVPQLATIPRTASVTFAQQVGATIVEHMFRGDSDELRRRGRKDLSLRRLALH